MEKNLNIYIYIYIYIYVRVCVCVCVCVCVYLNQFALRLKLTHDCKSTIFPFKIKIVLDKNGMRVLMNLLCTDWDCLLIHLFLIRCCSRENRNKQHTFMGLCTYLVGASPLAYKVKNLSAMQEIQVQCPGQESPLEKGMTIHSNILAWRVPWTEKPGGLHNCRSKIFPGLQWSILTQCHCC